MLVTFLLFIASAAADTNVTPTPNPERPTTLTEKDPSYESLVGSKHKPNAKYKIRNFNEGTVQGLEGMISSLQERADKNLDEISTLQSKVKDLASTESEKLSMSLEEMKKKQSAYSEKLSNYSKSIYQTNISLEEMRAELKAIDQEVLNMRNLLGSWKNTNSVSWE